MMALIQTPKPRVANLQFGEKQNIESCFVIMKKCISMAVLKIV
jgi:hypothetical protein